MTRLLRGFAVAAAVCLTAAGARADQPGVMTVTDDAGLFSAEGIARATEQFDGTKFKSATHYGVGTIADVPASKRADLAAAKSDADRKKVFVAIAKDLAARADRRGDVYTVVYRDDRGRYFAATVSDEQSDVHRQFGDKHTETVNGEFSRSLKRVKEKNLTGTAAKKEMDEALLAATRHVIDDLKHTAAPDAPAAGTHTTSAPRAAAGGGSGMMSYLCIGLVAVAGIWLVVGLVRSLFGGGMGGGGMGGGGYGGYGGGGGGFFSSLMGGMFGAAAGMYMYDNFFGGHSSSAMAGDSYDTAGGTDNADGNFDNGGQAADGGGWDDAGGTDAGTGGGWDDAGGGGDFGGDDFGGGGGDFGGGGDW